MITPLWLAHHRGDELGRCFQLGPLRICARCSGLFPALIVVMAIEARWPLPVVPRLGLALEVLLVVPGLWSVLAEREEANGWRCAAGALLGAAMGHAATVGHTRGFGAPEALLPLLASLAGLIAVLDRVWRRRRLAAT